MNVMKEIKIEKITLNVGAGQPGKPVEKGKMLLNKITGVKPVETRTKSGIRIPAWSLRPNLVIGCKATIRKGKAYKLLATLLEAKDNRIKLSSFDNNGNFSFGIKEYLDVPDLDYIPEVGIMGFEVAVTLERKGFRIKRRGLKKKKIPARHTISKEEAITFAKEKFNLEIVEKEEEE